MSIDQFAQTRRILKQTTDAADRAIDRHIIRSQLYNDHVVQTPAFLGEINDAADRAIYAQLAVRPDDAEETVASA
jgi:hypothetical protein